MRAAVRTTYGPPEVVQITDVPAAEVHAELVSIPEDGPVAAIPGDLAFVDVAPSTEGAHYALSIIRKAGISGSQDVLVYGATGAIGSAAVQFSWTSAHA